MSKLELIFVSWLVLNLYVGENQIKRLTWYSGVMFQYTYQGKNKYWTKSQGTLLGRLSALGLQSRLETWLRKKKLFYALAVVEDCRQMCSIYLLRYNTTSHFSCKHLVEPVIKSEMKQNHYYRVSQKMVLFMLKYFLNKHENFWDIL